MSSSLLLFGFGLQFTTNLSYLIPPLLFLLLLSGVQLAGTDMKPEGGGGADVSATHSVVSRYVVTDLSGQ